MHKRGQQGRIKGGESQIDIFPEATWTFVKPMWVKILITLEILFNLLGFFEKKITDIPKNFEKPKFRKKFVNCIISAPKA